jgi:hypothetical protein
VREVGAAKTAARGPAAQQQQQQQHPEHGCRTGTPNPDWQRLSWHGASRAAGQTAPEVGLPLDIATRLTMEAHFRQDLREVRVHTGPRAGASAEAAGADAYTAGRHVVFSPGRYAPETRAGRRLLAHELSHTIHHSRGGQDAGGSGGDPAPFEADARRAGEAIDRGEPAHLAATGVTPGVLFNRRGRRGGEASRPEDTSPERPDRPGESGGPAAWIEASHVGAAAEALRSLVRHGRAFLASRFRFSTVAASDQDWDRHSAGFERHAAQAESLIDAAYGDREPAAEWLRHTDLAVHHLRTLMDGVSAPSGHPSRLTLELAQASVQRMGTLRQAVASALAERAAASEAPAASAQPAVDRGAESVANMYVGRVLQDVHREVDGNLRVFEPRVVPAMEQLVLFEATRILRRQRDQILSRRRAMERAWRGADASERATIARNVERARSAVLEARRFRDRLRADAVAARRLGLLTRTPPANPWAALERLAAPRSMAGISGDRVPAEDRTLEAVRERWAQLTRAGSSPASAAQTIAHHVVRVGREEQVDAVTQYINAIFRGMPFLRTIMENDLPVGPETLGGSMRRGFQEAQEANRQAHNAIVRRRIEPFSMGPAVEAALARMPAGEVRTRMRSLAERERRQAAELEGAGQLLAGSGLVLLALVPVLGPELAFAAGVTLAVRGEARFYFQETVAQSALSPEEEMLGVARPGVFERWLNRLGPILDVAFAGFRAARTAFSEAQAVGGAMRAARVETAASGAVALPPPQTGATLPGIGPPSPRTGATLPGIGPPSPQTGATLPGIVPPSPRTGATLPGTGSPQRQTLPGMGPPQRRTLPGLGPDSPSPASALAAEELGHAPTLPVGRARDELGEAATVRARPARSAPDPAPGAPTPGRSPPPTPEPPAPTSAGRRGDRPAQAQAVPQPPAGVRTATPAGVDDVQRALRDNGPISLNLSEGSHQARWEAYGGEGRAPTYFRARNELHVSYERAPNRNEVFDALQGRQQQFRPRPVRRAPWLMPPGQATWAEVDVLLSTDPHSVHRSLSSRFHQMAWEGAGGSGPAPPIFRFGVNDRHLRVDLSSLSPERQRILVDAMP